MPVQIEIISPEKVLVSCQVDMAVLPGIDGDLAAMPEHAPIMSLLRGGVVTLYKDNAIILAQNTAETIKNHGGIHENKVIGYTDTLTETNMDTAEYFVKITPIENAIQLLGSAEIRIIHHNRTIYALTVCWQEEIAYEP